MGETTADTPEAERLARQNLRVGDVHHAGSRLVRTQLGQEDVRRRQIVMNEPRLMHGDERARERQRDVDDGGLVHWATLRDEVS